MAQNTEIAKLNLEALHIQPTEEAVSAEVSRLYMANHEATTFRMSLDALKGQYGRLR